MTEKTPDTAHEVLTLEEAAAFLRLHVRTLYSLAKQGKVPAQRISNRWRFSRSGLLDWLKNR